MLDKLYPINDQTNHSTSWTCADPGIWNFCQGGGGGGGSRSIWQKSSDKVFFLFCFFSPPLILLMVNFEENYHFSRFQRGSNIFEGGPTFPGGVQLLIPYRNPYNLWFSRGGPDPMSPPLDPHLLNTLEWIYELTSCYYLLYTQQKKETHHYDFPH